jgi:hypothetical protein
MRNSRAFSAVVFTAVIAATTVQAQDQSAAVVSDTGVQKILKRVPPADQGGGFHFTKHLAVVFGGIKPGQGIALGPAVSTTFSDGGYAQLKGVYSVRNFSLVQGRYDTGNFWHRRAILVTRARWQDAPELSLYRLGADSPRARAQYGERETELSTALEAHLTRLVHLSAGAGIERYAISTGTVDPGEDHALAGVPLEPGLSTRPWFSRTFVGVALDTRATGYARSGTVLDAALGDYRDQHDGTYSFQHVEGGIRQFVAIGSRGSFGATGRMLISHAGEGHAVPFFLMPTLGGGDALEAYGVYRFREHDAAWVRAEYRHAVHEMVDAVGFYEAGTVAPTVNTLAIGRAARDVGAGVIVHTRDAPILRFNVAHGGEGFGVTISFTAAGR